MGASSKFLISQGASELNPKATRSLLSSQACSNYHTFEVARSLVTIELWEMFLQTRQLRRLANTSTYLLGFFSVNPYYAESQ